MSGHQLFRDGRFLDIAEGRLAFELIIGATCTNIAIFHLISVLISSIATGLVNAQLLFFHLAHFDLVDGVADKDELIGMVRIHALLKQDTTLLSS